MVPCVIFEDEHLLVVNKPACWNTHAPAPHAGEGIYDWLRHREPRWARLAILHRLDKDTSGVLVFGKSPSANRALTRQFTEHSIRKRYRVLTDQPVRKQAWTVRSAIARSGTKYVSIADEQCGVMAETRFTRHSSEGTHSTIVAEPATGRTHQIRVHAAESGVPVLGDRLYGGSEFPRLCLHAESLTLKHPETDRERTFTVAARFMVEPRQALRSAFIDPSETNAFRAIHGAADGWPGWHVEVLGEYLLSQSEGALSESQRAELNRLAQSHASRGVYHKHLLRDVRGADRMEASPHLVAGTAAPDRFTIRENGLTFELSFNEGYSVGIFLDQRDNRRRLLSGHVAADFPLCHSDFGLRSSDFLNVFSYTCGFSVCAAKAGARVTSLDLSRKYLDWGRRNFELNGLDPVEHDFIYGDAFDWMRRLAKKGRQFDGVILDPPTFSRSKATGVFRAAKDYGELVRAAVPLLKSRAVLLASTNAADWPPGEFLQTIRAALASTGRSVTHEHYSPQPPDFPISREQPAYLKTAWFALD